MGLGRMILRQAEHGGISSLITGVPARNSRQGKRYYAAQAARKDAPASPPADGADSDWQINRNIRMAELALGDKPRWCERNWVSTPDGQAAIRRISEYRRTLAETAARERAAEDLKQRTLRLSARASADAKAWGAKRYPGMTF